MPELHLCIHCNKPIYDDENFVITNKAASEDLWQYAHAQCHMQHVSGEAATGEAAMRAGR